MDGKIHVFYFFPFLEPLGGQFPLWPPPPMTPPLLVCSNACPNPSALLCWTSAWFVVYLYILFLSLKSITSTLK